MDYAKIYDQLIIKAVNRPRLDGYVERHHILPTSLGGTNDDNNKVFLSAREHFIAHALLVKKYKQLGDRHSYEKMIYAFWFLSKTKGGERCVTGMQYEQARKLFSERNPNKDEDRKRRFSEKHKQGLYKYDYEKVSVSLKHTLSSLSVEQMSLRMKAVHSCDQQNRGNAIKRGKASQLKMTDTEGTETLFYSYDDVFLITGYRYDNLKVIIRKSSTGVGVLRNGNRVEFISKYEGKNRWSNKSTK